MGQATIVGLRDHRHRHAAHGSKGERRRFDLV
jgi:hypothetical protein